MKLSLVFELLLIFVLLAFAASKNVGRKKNTKSGIQNKDNDIKIEDNSINKYCKCSELYCNCCRNFQVPLVNLSGPGCAKLMYLNDDRMSISLSFGRKVITNRTLSSRKPSPVCMPLPGGISKFCGRVYNIARSGEEFRACLGLELQSKNTVEAAIRVSCFKFGPRGVSSEPADPLPLVPQSENKPDDDEDYEDDDDDDVDFGLSDDEYEETDDDDDDDDGGELDAVNDVDGADYTGFSLLGEDLLGDLFGSSSKKSNKNKKKQAPTVPLSTTTRRPRPTRRSTRRPASRVTTVRPFITRTTTVKIRPITRRTRRPTRRPSGGRPSKLPQTSTETTTASTTTPSQIRDHLKGDDNKQDSIQQENVYVTEKLSSIQSLTTSKPTTLEDPSLQMSLAHITGQLAVMPITPIVYNDDTDTNKKSTSPAEVLYEKIETMIPKNPSTASYMPTERIQDDMIQIVQNLDSKSEELLPKKDPTDEKRSHNYLNTFKNNYHEGIVLPKKKQRGGGFQLSDLDVLDLTQIGKSVGYQLGIFGHKRQNKNKDLKHPKGDNNNDGYEDILGNFSDAIGLNDRKDNKNNGNKRRQNKMMRGEWTQA